MKARAKAVLELFKETFMEWSEDKAPRLAAALAYYALFSLAPLLIIVIAIAGVLFGEQAVSGQIFAQIQGIVGPEAARAIQDMVANADQPATGLVAGVVGLATILLGASGLFGQLQDALNTIWEVAPKPGRGIMATVRERFISFTMVLGVGFLLLISGVLSAAVTAVGPSLGNVVGGSSIPLRVLDVLISFVVITVLFAMIYRILPDVDIAWGDVWIGAAMTSLLFALGKYAISFYLAHSSTASSYGAAGSLVVMLVWIYYSAQILLLGAEFTQVYAHRYGKEIRPADNAVALTEEARAEQGMARPETVARQPGGGEAQEAVATEAQAAFARRANGATGDTSPLRRVARVVMAVGAAVVGVAAVGRSLRDAHAGGRRDGRKMSESG